MEIRKRNSSEAGNRRPRLNRTIVEWKLAGCPTTFTTFPSVSIEPLWNGNMHRSNGIETENSVSQSNHCGMEISSCGSSLNAFTSCLNRTIVEWKFLGGFPSRPAKGSGLNRTIVEWKFPQGGAVPHRYLPQVSIEPLWNGNNIYFRLREGGDSVSIEPLWNGNGKLSTRNPSPVHVSIEPLWNGNIL